MIYSFFYYCSELVSTWNSVQWKFIGIEHKVKINSQHQMMWKSQICEKMLVENFMLTSFRILPILNIITTTIQYITHTYSLYIDKHIYGIHISIRTVGKKWERKKQNIEETMRSIYIYHHHIEKKYMCGDKEIHGKRCVHKNFLTTDNRKSVQCRLIEWKEKVFRHSFLNIIYFLET